jgi:AraC-like DNA-binding protein
MASGMIGGTSMNSRNDREKEREARRMQADRDELVERITRLVPPDGTIDPLKSGLHLSRYSSPTKPIHGVIQPSFCVVAQGSKEVLLGEERFRYGPAHYLLVSVELPTVIQVVEASEEQPYLGLRLVLDPSLVTSVMVETGLSVPRSDRSVKAMDVSPLDADLLDAVVRLVRLLDSQHLFRVLSPLVTREIVYRLLIGEQGVRLRHIAVFGGQSHRIVAAVERLHKNFDQSLRIESLAGELGMSVSGFHSHFKAVTGMSPLRFQKQLRLQEARRLMLAEGLDAAGAGYRVGYDDASHFSREYRRLFGNPPVRDLERLQEAARRQEGRGEAAPSA